jgi:hypothetical protein
MFVWYVVLLYKHLKKKKLVSNISFPCQTRVLMLLVSVRARATMVMLNPRFFLYGDVAGRCEGTYHDGDAFSHDDDIYYVCPQH